jgi:hypothetical protein
MKAKMIILLLVIAVPFLITGCGATLSGSVGYYNNSVTTINTTTVDNDGKLDILVNGEYQTTIYNSDKPDFVRKDRATVRVCAGIANTYVSWNFDIQAIGKKKGKTVAAHFPFYAVSYGGYHQTWIITDEQLAPYRGF